MVLEENKKDKMSEKVTNEEFLECKGENRILLNNVLLRKTHWVGYILRINCLLHDAIEGQMTEVKGIGRRKRTQLLYDLRMIQKIFETKKGS